MEHNKPCLHLVECIEGGAELVEAAEHNGLDQGAEVWKWHNSDPMGGPNHVSSRG